jgi:hypothetical protein
MHESSTGLAAWHAFYVIVGTSGGALIDLQFVVMTLIADSRMRTQTGGIGAFSTPTIVHLTAAVAVSAIMSAPWPSLGPLTVTLGLCGTAGLIYAIIVIRRAFRQTDYQPVWQDWLWYMALPCTAYGALLFDAVFIRGHSAITLFLAAGVALGLLLIGAHNAWDSVMHIVSSSRRDQEER